MILLKMAWRNLWRNKRRTLLTVASISFAVLVAVVMRGFQLGSYDNMIEGTLKATTSHLQIQQKDWWDDKTIDNIFESSTELEERILSQKYVTHIYPRFQNFALASSGPQTKGVPVIGMEPDREKSAAGIHNLMQEGKYLTAEDPGVLISKDLARFLNIQLGDSLVLFGQGYHGVTAVGKYPVSGIFDFSYSSLANAAVYMNLWNAQQLYGAPNMLTTLSINIDQRERTKKVRKAISAELPEGLVVRQWQEMNKTLLQSIQLDSASGQIMIAVLYMVIGFGIFGTLLMMAAERKREFSVMNSIGMKRGMIIRLIVFETFWLAVVAVLVGMAVSVPVNIYFHYNPIPLGGETSEVFAQFNIKPMLQMSDKRTYIWFQAIIVLILSLLSMLAPINMIKKLNVVDSLRGR